VLDIAIQDTKNRKGKVKMFELQEVPELYSAGESFFAFAFSTSSFHVLLIEKRSCSCALMMVGVMSPPSIATAIATFTSAMECGHIASDLIEEVQVLELFVLKRQRE
jgi:hypothetical protein